MWLCDHVIVEEEEQLSLRFRDYSVAHSGRCTPGEDGYVGVRESTRQSVPD
jgi:hypothetical protein